MMVVAWEGSDRREHLPPDWQARRLRRFKMDGYRCTAVNVYGERCEEPAEECDHIGSRDDHRLEMLRSLCTWHHGKKSARQGNRAAYQRRRKIDERFRRTETHPGLL